jgi:flavin-dependent dehydrogenase
MMDYQPWDAIIVGARVAGALTALRLARRGHRVLVLDKARFPSDTLSTHNFGRETTVRLAELGLLTEIAGCGAPPLTRHRMAAPDEGVGYTGTLREAAGFEAGYCIRRIVLDDILVRAARAAGAEVREQTTVTGLIWDEDQVGGVVAQTDAKQYKELAQVVVGADGRYSRVARWVRASAYRSDPALTPAYYAYFRGVAGPRDVQEVMHTRRRDYLLLPTNDHLTCVLVALPQEELNAYRAQHERNFMADINAVLELADRFTGAERVGPVRGATDLDSYMRVPIGPGWALVGDAGAHVHPVTARGISLAVRDAELLGEALADALEGRRDPSEALSEYHRERDIETEREYRRALHAAKMTGKPLPGEVLRLWAALGALPEDADEFVNGRLRIETEAELAVLEERAATPTRSDRPPTAPASPRAAAALLPGSARPRSDSACGSGSRAAG